MATRRITPKNSVGRKRLMLLVNHIEKKLTDKKWRKFFNMATWGSPLSSLPDGGRAYLKKHGRPVRGKIAVINNECGTSACLLGHACTVPGLRKQGFHSVWRGDSINHDVDIRVGTAAKHVSLMKDDDADFARVAFGISESRFDQMFRFTGENNNISTVTPEEAVANMRLTIARIDVGEGWMF